MFLLKSLGSALWGSSGASDAELIQIPSGALFAVASTSAASARRLLFPDASLTVRRTSTPFTAQLVCTRIVDEGDASESDTDPADALDALAIDDDQRIFAVDESIAFRVLLTRPSEIVFVWRDPLATQASKAAVLEFVVSCEDTTLATVSAFEAVVYTCMFERREGKSHEDAEEAEVEAYIKFIKKKSQSAAVSAGVTDSVGAALPAKTSKEKSTKPEHRAVTATTAASSSSLQNPVKGKKGGMVGVEEKSSHKTPVKQTSKDSTSTSPTPMSMGTTPLAINNNVGDAVDKLVAPAGESIVKVKADLYLYDNRVSQFNRMREDIFAELIRTSKFEFTLVISDESQAYISQPLDASMNPQFNSHACCFVWLWKDDVNSDTVYPWSVKFADASGEALFRDAFGACLYEVLNKSEFLKVKAEDRPWIVNAYKEDVEMADADAREEDDEDEGSNEDSDEDDDRYQDAVDGGAPGDKTAKITNLTIGKRDRSYFVRGQSIGVLSHPSGNSLEYSTVINNVASLDNKAFTPSKVLLHDGDRSMLLMHPNKEHTVYRMDLGVGKVVEEWTIDDVTPVHEIIPSAKNNAAAGGNTLVGINHNSIFRIDPRLSAKKLVQSESKTYTSNVGNFNCATTTSAGNLAVGSSKGDIRLYNKLNVRAKTHLPGLGDPVIGIDTTEDGKWIIATCRTYLLLVCTEAKDAKVSGAVFSGFNKSLGSQKPFPVRLQLRPEHVAWMGGVVSFTTAKFNTSSNADSAGQFEETSIVTSTGNFVVSWNFRRVKQGKLNDYTIKQFGSNVVADNFKFGEDQNIIVALPEDVHMVAKKNLQTPTKMLKSRSSIVNSPY